MKLIFCVLFTAGCLVDILQLSVEATSPEDVMEHLIENCNNKRKPFWSGWRKDQPSTATVGSRNDESNQGINGRCQWSSLNGFSCQSKFIAEKEGADETSLDASANCVVTGSNEKVLNLAKEDCVDKGGEWTVRETTGKCKFSLEGFSCVGSYQNIKDGWTMYLTLNCTVGSFSPSFGKIVIWNL